MTVPARAGYHMARMDLEMAQQQHLSFMTVLAYRIRVLLSNGTFEIAEAINAIVAIIWGVLVLNPYADTFGSAPSFRLLADVAPEWVWGAAVFVGGVQALVAMLYGHREWRMGATLCGVGTWSSLAYLFFAANPEGLALALYPPLALLALWALLRLGMRMGIQWTQ